MGLASGAAVVIFQYYGAKKYDQVRKDGPHLLVMDPGTGVADAVGCVGDRNHPLMLGPDEEPTQAVPEATTVPHHYYCNGVLGLMLYNMGSGVLRPWGTPNAPCYFLVGRPAEHPLDLLFRHPASQVLERRGLRHRSISQGCAV